MKKRIALVLCLVLLTGMFAGCDLDINSILSVIPGFGTTNPTTPTVNPTEPTAAPTQPTPEMKIITVAEALALCGEPGNITTERYYIKGTIVSIDNANYGAMTVQDTTGTISVYNSTDANDVPYAQMAEKPYKGDVVLLHCILQNHNGTKEVNQAHIISFEKDKTPVDESQYTAATLAEARAAAKGAKVKVTGVVARITYATGKIPSGVMLVDNTGSIYVYDADIAARVAIGNEITLLAEKDFWILDDEQGNADKFGYKGCNQLTNATYVSGDKENHDFNTDWIESISVKALIETPATQDITTKIYKTTALVYKDENPGYVNYYFYDLDGTTGTYTYTQCNGSDFAWLDAFNGKICTVYLTALNAKSTASGCVWRLLPVAVKDEGFDPSSVNGAEHGVKYYGVDQFQKSYTADPAKSLLTSVNAELLGFTGIELSYASSNPEVIAIENNVMHCLKSGKATVTITGTYGEQTYSETVEISVSIWDSSATYPSVKDAIDAEVGQTVTVRGIVGPSLVNKNGFYLIDKTGVIAVLVKSDATMAEIEIGNEVVLTAVRYNNTKGGTSYYGQTCLNNAVVEVNFYGEHAYPTDAFAGEITPTDFYSLNPLEDYSTSVFVMKAKVVVSGGGFSVNVKLSDGTKEVTLYSGNKDQYAWLIDMAGQEITVEIAACNWNDKTYYRGCVLSVINADGTKTYNTLNFK